MLHFSRLFHTFGVIDARFRPRVDRVPETAVATLAAVAEMEREIIVERTKAGLAQAKAKGKTLARPAKTTSEQRKMVGPYNAEHSVGALEKPHQISEAAAVSIVQRGREVDTDRVLEK